MEKFLQQLNQDIKDIFQYNIETTKAFVVPTRHDPALTFPIGADKQGKLLETCVLMVDIRNSTKISRQLKNDKVKLGKIYSAFIYAMTSIADEYGYVRNIVGDRVMVVFEPKDCFVNAINCASLMYTVVSKILTKHVAIDGFKVGIGIDFGEMLVLKTGIRKKHEEQSEYKSLVWVGDPANVASKLCDFANKEYSSPKFEISYEKLALVQVLSGYINKTQTPLEIILNKPLEQIPQYKNEWKKQRYSMSFGATDFAKRISVGSSGWTFEGNNVTSFNIVNQTGSTASILLSGKVYAGFKKVDPKSPYISRLSSREYPEAPYTGSSIYGGYLLITDIDKMKL